ncbi:unnamed protein product [Rotaria socialis]|uniref:MULE transposase domain-containing protein n=1 Tax=Rotaria socialis TaxID=392032 RepID=A0A821SCD8_9BILA|nr:unnamed protein product [Rotaria socialis]
MYPPLPTCQNFVIPDFISKIIDSIPFLLFDQTRDEFGGRLLVFSLRTVKDSKTYPVLFALTSNRKEATYIAIPDVIRTEAQHHGVSFASHMFISDYEQAWTNAVQRKLITTSISECWFHHCVGATAFRTNNSTECQILQLLDRRKEISVATDLFLNLLFYSTNLASAASIKHILKSKQLEVSTKKIQSIHTCIAQHVHSEPIYEQIEITDDESDIEEFDPMLFSSPSNSINNSDNENPTQILEARMSASKQARSKETNIVTQTDLIQLTYDVINEESSTTNNEDGLNLNFMFNNEQSVTILT